MAFGGDNEDFSDIATELGEVQHEVHVAKDNLSREGEGEIGAINVQASMELSPVNSSEHDFVFVRIWLDGVENFTGNGQLELTSKLVSDQQESILAVIAGWLVPLMRPAGLGDWRICVSLISGFMAKESVVSTLNILFQNDVTAVIKPATAASLLVFSLLYTPCVASIASIRRELGRKWALCVIIWQCVIAWAAAFAVHLIAG